MNNDKEFKTLWAYLTKTAMEKMNISKRTAELRIKAIQKSGILEKLGSPDNPTFQIGIDVAMQIPQLGKKEY